MSKSEGLSFYVHKETTHTNFKERRGKNIFILDFIYGSLCDDVDYDTDDVGTDGVVANDKI